MHKRIVDGTGLWTSEKLREVQPPSYRAELANLIPLAGSTGTFECNPRLIWRTVYSLNRTDISEDDVAKILDAFEQAKILFRWTVTGGKTWGYRIGIHGKGRLPAPSQKKYDRGGEAVPLEKLEEFMGDDAFKAYRRNSTDLYRDSLEGMLLKHADKYKTEPQAGVLAT